VAAEDPNHPNPYMFTGRRFDIEIGLYYYRARQYSRFMDGIMANGLAEDLSDLGVASLRASMHAGTPLGSDNFLRKLKKMLGWRVRPLPVGRPSKSKKTRRSRMHK
jgi:hypothetical protein